MHFRQSDWKKLVRGAIRKCVILGANYQDSLSGSISTNPVRISTDFGDPPKIY